MCLRLLWLSSVGTCIEACVAGSVLLLSSVSDADARTKRVTRPRSRRSSAGSRSVGNRVWRVRRVDLVFSEASESGFEDPCPCEFCVEVARVVIRDVSRARVDGSWRLVGSAMDHGWNFGD